MSHLLLPMRIAVISFERLISAASTTATLWTLITWRRWGIQLRRFNANTPGGCSQRSNVSHIDPVGRSGPWGDDWPRFPSTACSTHDIFPDCESLTGRPLKIFPILVLLPEMGACNPWSYGCFSFGLISLCTICHPVFTKSFRFWWPPDLLSGTNLRKNIFSSTTQHFEVVVW